MNNSASVIKSTIHTVAFYDAVRKVPLTTIELYKNLVHTKGLDKAGQVSFYDFLKILDEQKSALRPYITNYRGFYFLKGNNTAYKDRIEIGKTSIKKWRIARKMIRAISFLPYVRMIAVTGSLALHTTNKNSDIDVLIVVKSGHIWTVRMLVTALMQVLKRRRHGTRVRDRICLNHYITDDDLVLHPKHLFSAHICSSFIPIWSKNQTDENLIKQNSSWAKRYLLHFPETLHTNLKKFKPDPKPLDISRFFIEYTLAKTVARGSEKLLRAIQAQKIQRSIDKNKTERQEVIFNDCALVFHHPRPKNQEALYLYKENLRKLGFINKLSTYLPLTKNSY